MDETLYSESDVRKMLRESYKCGYEGPLELINETTMAILNSCKERMVKERGKNRKLRDYPLWSGELG